MFQKILIANRGEIACRIIKTAKTLNITTVAVYSSVDEHALHVRLADESYPIGPAPSRDSYLNIHAIIQAALNSGAQAIHPGYGFLSENAEFAEQCAKHKLIFIGPSPQAIRAMGSKSTAKILVGKAQVPVIPGYEGKQDLQSFQKAAKHIGYPLLIKPCAGGGGKGMKIVRHEHELEEQLNAARREAMASFGDDELLLEKYLENPRHIEIQIMADQHGQAVHLFERDCSIQRRHQKVIEEAPASSCSLDLRHQMGAMAIAAARAVNYVGAGTVEFLVTPEQDFYFIEMNTRLQVEHPVTEMITGLDLVEWQLRIAAGESLPLQQTQIQSRGHAIEVRLYAEDPHHDFRPSTGIISHLRWPEENEHLRIDVGITQGDEVSSYYDPMIAKLIAWDEHREGAIKQLTHALKQIQLVGLLTNIEFLLRLVSHEAFMKGQCATGFIQAHQSQLIPQSEPVPDLILASAAFFKLFQEQEYSKQKAQISDDIYSPWFEINAWRMNASPFQTLYFLDSNILRKVDYRVTSGGYLFRIEDREIEVQGTFSPSFPRRRESRVPREGGDPVLNKKKISSTYELNLSLGIQDFHLTLIQENENKLVLIHDGLHYTLNLNDRVHSESDEIDADHRFHAVLPGTVVALPVKKGEQIEKGAPLIVIEAMKIEHTLYAPYTGIVDEIYFGLGDLVKEGEELISFSAEEKL